MESIPEKKQRLGFHNLQYKQSPVDKKNQIITIIFIFLKKHINLGQHNSFQRRPETSIEERSSGNIYRRMFFGTIADRSLRPTEKEPVFTLLP